MRLVPWPSSILLLQWVYGEDGFDGMRLEDQKFELLKMSNKDMEWHYAYGCCAAGCAIAPSFMSCGLAPPPPRELPGRPTSTFHGTPPKEGALATVPARCKHRVYLGTHWQP